MQEARTLRLSQSQFEMLLEKESLLELCAIESFTKNGHVYEVTANANILRISIPGTEDVFEAAPYAPYQLFLKVHNSEELAKVLRFDHAGLVSSMSFNGLTSTVRFETHDPEQLSHLLAEDGLYGFGTTETLFERVS